MTQTASAFLVIGERTNITGSPKFAKAIKAGDWDSALAIARQQVENGDNVIEISYDGQQPFYVDNLTVFRADTLHLGKLDKQIDPYHGK